MNVQNPRLVIPICGIIIATLTWLMVTLRSPDGLVSYEFVSSTIALALLGTVIGILWPSQPVPPLPPTEAQLAALFDSRYLRSGQPLPTHSHDGVYADVDHTHPELEHQLSDHDHPLQDHDHNLDPHSLDPALSENTLGVRELIDEPPPVIATPGRRPYRRT